MNIKHCSECNRLGKAPPGKKELVWLPRPPCFNPKPGVTVEPVQCPECRIFGEFPAIKFIRELMQNTAIHSCVSLLTDQDQITTQKTAEAMVLSSLCAAVAALGRTLTDEEARILNTGLSEEQVKARIDPLLEAYEARKNAQPRN